MDYQLRLKKLLEDNGRSVTRQRLKVFDALQKSKQPLTVTELSKQLPGLDKVSVYRTIELYERINVVHRLWTGFKSKIELSEAFSTHHHHFTCLNCGQTVGLKSEELEQSLRAFESEHNFELTQHSVELSGYCKDCKTN